ncbi:MULTISPECIES: alpha/beta fold hydrolase [unclassified Curtobacterium]|nr:MULTISPECIES: alpha/beta fold hydrolase [unclassified Curtobacterium]
MPSRERQVLLADRRAETRGAYVIPLVYRFPGLLEHDRVRDAWFETQMAHPALRTRYDLEHSDGLKSVEDAIQVDNYQFFVSLDEGKDLKRVVEGYSLATLRPEIGDVCRLTHVQTGTQTILVFAFHHVAFDEESIRLFVSSFEASFEGAPADAAADGGDPESGPVLFAPRLTPLAGMGDNWLPLSRGLARDGTAHASAGRLTFEVSAEDNARIAQLRKQFHVGPLAIIGGAVCAALLSYSNNTEAHFVSPVSRRSNKENSVGYYVDLLPVRLNPGKSSTFAGVCEQVQEQLLENIDADLEAALTFVQGERRTADPSSTYTQVTVSLHAGGERPLHLDGMDGAPVDVAPKIAKSPLAVHAEGVAVEGAGFRVSIEYDLSVISADAATTVANDVERALKCMVEDFLQPLNSSGIGRSVGTAPMRKRSRRGPRAGGVDSSGSNAASAKSIVRVWESTLGLKGLGPSDDFFDVGGDSLSAVSIVGALRHSGYDVSVVDIFQHRTPLGIAAKIGSRDRAESAVTANVAFSQLLATDVERLPPDAVDAYPLTSTQLGMVIENQADPVSALYHNVTAYSMRDSEPLNERALTAAVAAAVERHEVLRSSIHLRDYSEPIQVVHDVAEVPLTFESVAALSSESGEDRVKRYIAAERATPFAEGEYPLIRFHAIQERLQWRLAFTEYHPILEGWSLHALLNEILEDYRRLRRGIVPTRPSPAFKFSQYVALEREAAESRDQQDFWLRSSEGSAVSRTPEGWSSEEDGYEQNYLDLSEYVEPLRALAVRQSVSMKTVFLTAHIAVQAVLAGEPDRISSGLVCDTRPELPGSESVLGLFVNTVPFAVEVADASWSSLLQRVRQAEIDVWPNRRFPYGKILAKQPGLRQGDVLFAYLNFRNMDRSMADPDGGLDESPGEFNLEVTVQGRQMCLAVNKKTVSTEAVEILRALYLAAFDGLVQDVKGSAVGLADRVALRTPKFMSVATTSRHGYAVPRGVWGVSVPDLDSGAIVRQLETLGGGIRSLEGVPKGMSRLTDSHSEAGAADSVEEISRVQQEIRAIWEAELGIRQVAVSDDFFELGGSSLLAVRLRSRIQQDYGVAISIPRFYQNATPSGLASLVVASRGQRRQESDGDGGLFNFESILGQHTDQGTVEKKTAVFIHPVGGTAYCYRRFAEALRTDFNSVGVNAEESFDSDLTDVEVIAAQYVARLTERGVSPDLIVGWSAGALIALETARQYARRDASSIPPRVILVDPPSPRAQPTASERRVAEAFQLMINGDRTSETPASGANVDAKALRSTHSRIFQAARRYECDSLSAVRVKLALASDNPYGTEWTGLGLEETVTLSGGHFDVFDAGNLDLLTSLTRETTEHL